MTLKHQLKKFRSSHSDRMLDLFNQSHARVGLGHTGGHIKLSDWLDFQMGFAQAKDAVFSQFDIEKIKNLCQQQNLKYIQVHSQTTDHTQFLLRPDLGKLLAPESHKMLEQLNNRISYDLLIIISGGLSPLAIQHHIPYFLPEFFRVSISNNW